MNEEDKVSLTNQK